MILQMTCPFIYNNNCKDPNICFFLKKITFFTDIWRFQTLFEVIARALVYVIHWKVIDYIELVGSMLVVQHTFTEGLTYFLNLGTIQGWRWVVWQS